MPRSAHARWEPPAGRRDPVAVLAEQNATRLPELVPIRHGRMLVSSFTFFRGAAALMAADLAEVPRTELHAQLCGDAHLSNFGAFAAPDRRLVFGLNDFDETLPGPFEWDVKRLVASFAVAGRHRGFSAKRRARIELTAARSYREAMIAFAGMRVLDLWYARLDVEELTAILSSRGTAEQLERFDRAVTKGRAKDNVRALGRLTTVVDGRPRITSDPPLIVPLEELVPPDEQIVLEDLVRGVIRSYRRSLASDRRRLLERFRYADAARKVVGVGSVGKRTWVVLLLGDDDGDPLFLQLKEAGPSVLEAYLGRSKVSQHGQRVVEGQRLMQAASDVMLGWLRTTDADGAPPRLLHPPAVGRQGVRRRRRDGAERDVGVRRDLRMDARARACPVRRRGGDRRLSGVGRRVRPRAGVVRRGLRGSERARLRGVRRRRRVRAPRGRDRPLDGERPPLAIDVCATLARGRGPRMIGEALTTRRRTTCTSRRTTRF